jgi:hypothetical protein
MPAPPLVAPPPALVQVTLEPPLLGSAMIWLPSALMSWPFLRSSFHWLLVLHTLGPTMREDGKGWGVRQVVASGSPLPSGWLEDASCAIARLDVKNSAARRILQDMRTPCHRKISHYHGYDCRVWGFLTLKQARVASVCATIRQWIADSTPSPGSAGIW